MTDVIYSYPTLEPPPQLRVVGLRLDGNCRPDLIESAASRVHLFAARSGWTRAALEVELAAEAEALGALERRHGPVESIVVVRGPATRVRQAVRLTRSSSDPARWQGTIEVDRANFRGRAILRARLTAAAGGVPHRLVAEAAGWDLLFDEPAGLRLGGKMPVRWVDFAAEDAPPLARQFPDATHVVSFGPGDEPPELWLNASFEGLDGLLRDDDGRDAPGRGVHDALRLGIARAVWLELVGVAMAGIRLDDADEGRPPQAGWPEAEWQRDVLGRILPRVAPGRPPRELLELAAAEWRSPRGAGEFYARAEAAIGEMLQAGKALRRYIQSVEGEIEA